MLKIISSSTIEPVIGMRIKTLQIVDGESRFIGKMGTIRDVRSNLALEVGYDDMYDWWGTARDWNSGAYEIQARSWKELYNIEK